NARGPDMGPWSHFPTTVSVGSYRYPRSPETDYRAAGGKMVFQSSFMLTTVQPLATVSFEPLSSFASASLRSLGIFALGVVVVDVEAILRAAAGRGPLQLPRMPTM